MSHIKNKCDAIKIKKCEEMNPSKVCNPTTGQCNDKKYYDKKLKDARENIPKTETIRKFIKEIKGCHTAAKLIEGYKKSDDDDKVIKELYNKSKQGFIYERLWDLCIKLGVTDIADKNTTTHGIGNINEKDKAEFKNIKDFFDIGDNKYIDEGIISGNSGGYSDITFVNKNTLYLVSAKYINIKTDGNDNNTSIKDFDIQNLCTIIEDRAKDGYEDIKTLLFVKDKGKFKTLCDKANKSSNILIKYISPNGNYENVYDLNDLEVYFSKLKRLLELYAYLEDDKSFAKFKTEYLEIGDRKTPFIPRFHQELFIEKINALIKKGDEKILVGAIPRSGKTYIMAGTILKHVKEHEKRERDVVQKTYNNYVIITPAPSETLQQYKEAFDNHIDFDRYNIKADIVIKADSFDNLNVVKNKTHHYVYLISKQRLGNINGDKGDKYTNASDGSDASDASDASNDVYKRNIEKYFGKKNNKMDIIFMDEAHFGMSSKIAQQIVECINGNGSIKVFVTATYNKPQNIYGVKNKNLIKWDLDDIKMAKNMAINKINDGDDKEKIKGYYNGFREILVHFSKKFSEKIVNGVLKGYGWIWDDRTSDKLSIKMLKNNKHIIEKIKNQYKHFPEPYMITAVWDNDFIKKERENIEGTNYGFDMGKLFELKNKTKFINEEQLVQFLQYYFGYPDKTKGYDIQNQYTMNGIIPRIERICNNNCRTLQSPSHKTTQLWFLPPDNIAKVVGALLLLLSGSNFEYVFNKYMFYIALPEDKSYTKYDNVVYMRDTDKIKKEVKEIEEKIKDKEKGSKDNNRYYKYEGLIILAGKRLQLGISLENVDIVSLFTNITASDAIYQMIFRSMTEIDGDGDNDYDAICNGNSFCPKKKYGFMVDLNPQRTIYTLDYFVKRISKNDNDSDDDDDSDDKKYNRLASLINIDKDKFISKYNTEEDNRRYVKEFLSKLYSSWEANTDNIKHILNEQDIFNASIKALLQKDFDIRRLFNDANGGGKKAVVTPVNQLPAGPKKELKDIYMNQKKLQNDVKEIDIIDVWQDIISESISILSYITSYYNKEIACIFNKDKRSDFKYEILKIFEELKEDDYLRETFIHFLKNKVIRKGTITDSELFNMVYNVVKMFNESTQQQRQRSPRQSGGKIVGIDKIIYMGKQKIYNIKNIEKLLELINENLSPKLTEKKTRGEVFTPMKLVNEMLDVLPKDVWGNKDLKWLDPAAGMGNFPVAVYMRLMEGLKDVIRDEEKRRKHILENMLYMVELDKGNVFMMKKIFCSETYRLNIYEGSFINFKKLKTDKRVIKVMIDYKEVVIDNKYNIILGNPPFQYKEGKEQAQSIWRLFVERSYMLLEKDGYLLMIHPSGWRDIDGRDRNVFDYMKAHNLIYLNMKDFKTGQNVFKGASTNFDYYLVQNTLTNSNKTTINDYDNTKGREEEYEIDLNSWDFIPSGKFKDFKQIIAKKNEERVEVLYNRTLYGSDKQNMSQYRTDFPCCYSITKNDGMKYKYSNIDKGHFGVSKVIWSNGTATYPIVDKDGVYGLTQFCYAIIDKKNKLEAIKGAMEKSSFIKLMKYLVFKENHKYNYKIIRLFKKDFYNYFVDKKISGGKKSKANKYRGVKRFR